MELINEKVYEAGKCQKGGTEQPENERAYESLRAEGCSNAPEGSFFAA